MAFQQVEDIQELINRQNAIDQTRLSELDHAKEEHPEINFDDLIPSIIDRKSRGEKCSSGCNSPLVSVESIAEGDLIRICRHCINAIKLASLVHKNPNTICYQCVLKYTPDGIVSGAIHLEIEKEDSTYQGHPDHEDGTTRPGLTTMISRGKVTHDPETDEVKITD